MSPMPYGGVEYSDDDEKLKRYKARVEAAVTKSKQWLESTEMWLSYYRNKPSVYTRGGQKVRVPVAISHVDAMFSALTAVEVEMKVNPLATTQPAQAEVAEEALRNEWGTQKVQQEVELATKDSLTTGMGWVFVGYEYDEGEEEKTDEELQSESLDAVNSYYEENGSYPPEGEESALGITPLKTVTLKDRVFVEHVFYDDLLVDPEARKWQDVRWVVRRLILPWEQVMEDDYYQNTTDLAWDAALNAKWRTTPQDKPEDDEKRVTVYELWDFETGEVCTFTSAHDKILRSEPNFLDFHDDYQDKSPFVPLILRSNPGEVYGIGDIEAMKPAIDEQNVLRSSLATYVERAKPKLLAKEGSLTQAGKRAAKSQEWGDIVEISLQGSLADIAPFVIPAMPAEAFMLDGKAAEDSRNAIGLNELLQGILPVGKKTATGMGMLQNASEIRQSERKNRMERFYTDIGTRMLNVMQQFYDQKRIVKLVGDREDVVWTWTGDDLTMISALEITLQPKIQVDDQTLRENMLMLKNIFMPDPSVDQAELNRFILQSMRVPKDWIKRLLKTEEQKQAEAQGGLQQQALQAGAEQGMMPDASAVPGPMDGGETLQVANQGEIPPGALDLLGTGGGTPPPGGPQPAAE